MIIIIIEVFEHILADMEKSYSVTQQFLCAGKIMHLRRSRKNFTPTHLQEKRDVLITANIIKEDADK